MKQEFYTIKEAATIMNCPEQTLYTRIRRSRVKAIKADYRVFISHESLQQMIADQQNEAIIEAATANDELRAKIVELIEQSNA